jgi:hypothetical protein
VSPRIHNFSRVAPIVMSLLSLALIIEGLMQFGLHHREVDEGWQAHLFQLLMLLQVPIVALFVATANWKHPSRALLVLGLQAAAWSMTMGALYIAGF